VLTWLFVRHPARYVRWRSSLFGTTIVALVGFLAFPVMPPRLITSKFASGAYVDTLRTIGGLWNFEDGTIAKLSNQYAAMPSLHFAWSLWCCLAVWPLLRTRWARALAVAHPTLTLIAIVATASSSAWMSSGGARRKGANAAPVSAWRCCLMTWAPEEGRAERWCAPATPSKPNSGPCCGDGLWNAKPDGPSWIIGKRTGSLRPAR